MKWYFIWAFVGISSFTGCLVIMLEVAIISLIISIAGFLSLFFIDKSKKSSNNLSIATEKKIFYYLKINAGKAYTANALINRIVEKIEHPSLKKYVKKNGGSILNKMLSNDEIGTVQKDGEPHYFFPTES